jgi:hypothetical protein
MIAEALPPPGVGALLASSSRNCGRGWSIMEWLLSFDGVQ